MKLQTCVHCGSSVMIPRNGLCPSCRRHQDDTPDPPRRTEPPEVFTPPTEPVKPNRSMGALGGALGAVAAAAFLAASQSSGVIDSMTIVTVLGAAGGAFGAFFLIRALTGSRT